MKNITYKEEPEKDKTEEQDEEIQKGGLKEDVEGSTFL